MRIFKYAIIIALSLPVTASWAGEEQATQEKPYIVTTQRAKITAMVEAIDHETRIVTLRGPQGNSVTFTASDEARNLDQVDVDDIVNIEYIQSLSIEVMANPGVEPGAAEMAVAARTEEGEMPGLAAVDAKVVVATVEEINLEANTFKLKWPDESVEQFTAMNPENLKLAAVGDLVVITKTEALAISVEEATAE